MGIGQHYIKAEWAGKHFGEKDINNIYLNEKEKNNIRNYIIKSIKLEDLFDNNNVDYNILNSLIKLKPVKSLYSSKSIISPEVESLMNVNEIESHTNKISYLSFQRKDKINHINSLIPFISLHESRNISVFHYYNNIIINYILAKKTIDFNEFKSFINYGCLLEDSDFNKNFINELNIHVNKVNDVVDGNKVFELSKTLFNKIHPKIYEMKVKKYRHYNWVIMHMTDNTIGISDSPIINFAEKWHNYDNFNLFKEIEDDNKIIVKESLFCFLTKNLILWGIDKNSINIEIFNRIKESKKNLLNFTHDIYHFLIVYNLMCSFDFYSITSEQHKLDLFNYLIKNFNNMKKLYQLNVSNRNKFFHNN